MFCQGCVTYLRPCDQAEELYLGGENGDTTQLIARLTNTEG